jgi:hypothetical protein
MNATLATVTLISIAVAATMTVIVVRMIWLERRRSEARVEALAADIHRGIEVDLTPATDPPVVNVGPVFATAERSSGQRMFSPGILVLCASVAILLAVGISRYSANPARPVPTAQATAMAATPLPLELLALDQERADDHLIVRGVVRNPPRGVEVDHLTAVVLLFSQQGGFLTSGRAPVESTSFEPGTDAAFVITVPGAADVGRYRVSFRTDDKVVPHIDRRNSQS